ncbi:hypothetical protein SEA_PAULODIABOLI_47 [Microbacterium phage PauloDiaboli]|nr:hypothetical protein SEA_PAULODIABOLI_47 [Microbacterium phage PauloDiaboli]QWY83897.1 hypothetical protein SEA_A3WALLY_47 [Microbacterium phage A3Wally]
MTEDGLRPGEKIIYEQEVDLTEGGFVGEGELEEYILQNRLRSMRDWHADREYAHRVAGEILSEYYGDHDAK